MCRSRHHDRPAAAPTRDRSLGQAGRRKQRRLAKDRQRARRDPPPLTPRGGRSSLSNAKGCWRLDKGANRCRPAAAGVREAPRLGSLKKLATAPDFYFSNALTDDAMELRSGPALDPISYRLPRGTGPDQKVRWAAQHFRAQVITRGARQSTPRSKTCGRRSGRHRHNGINRRRVHPHKTRSNRSPLRGI